MADSRKQGYGAASRWFLEVGGSWRRCWYLKNQGGGSKTLINEVDYRLKSVEVIHKISYCVSKIHAVNYVKLIRRACYTY
jgi:hypothetical protein